MHTVWYMIYVNIRTQCQCLHYYIHLYKIQNIYIYFYIIYTCLCRCTHINIPYINIFATYQTTKLSKGSKWQERSHPAKPFKRRSSAWPIDLTFLSTKKTATIWCGTNLRWAKNGDANRKSDIGHQVLCRCLGGTGQLKWFAFWSGWS